MTPKLYKASEVCDATGLQPYVLRSWEKEFPSIGVQKSQDSSRLYRQADLEQVLRIKQLVFGEGLTLAGARRRIEGTLPAAADAGEPEIGDVLDTLGADARSRIDLVRRGLRSILNVLSKQAGAAMLAELPRNGSSGERRTALSSRDHRDSPKGRRGGPSRLRQVGSQSAPTASAGWTVRGADRPGEARQSAKGATAARPPKKRAVTTKRSAATRKGRSSKRKRASA